MPATSDGLPRVVVTGAGVLCPNGGTTSELWEDALVGRSRARRLDFEGLGSYVVCSVEDELIDTQFEPKARRQLDRSVALALIAAERAVADAGGLPGDDEGHAVVVGTGIGGFETIEDAARKVIRQGVRGASPFTVPKLMPNAASSHVAMRFAARGPCLTVATACASGAQAIALATSLIQRGEASTVIAGGTEGCITPFALTGFSRMGAMSRRLDDPSSASRPFDGERDGFVMSEGAAFVVLESLEDARRRGAPVRGEVLGSGQNSDAFHIVAPDPSGGGGAACIRRALSAAGVRSEQVVSINAHGTSTSLNDLAESFALHAAFGPTVPPVTALKGVTGHALGASGALEALVAMRSATTGIIPPTANLHTKDPEIELDIVSGEPRSCDPGPVVSNSFGFGGHNCVLVLGPGDAD